MTWYEDRWYQREAKDALLRDIKKYNPVIAIQTGGGKTIIMGRFIYELLEDYPQINVLIISNTQEILKQDHATIKKFFPGIHIGLYSSGLESKTIEKITVAGIQSIYKKPELFKHFHLIIFDECHTLPPNKKSMYMQFIKAVPAKYVGMSATVFRIGQGLIYEGKDRLFNKLSYDLTSMKKFNRLVEEGYLCKLISKPTNYQLNSEGVKTTAGDFNLKDLSEKHDREEITNKAIKEVVEFGKNYKSWLIFAIDIDHANHINEELLKQGIKSKALHSDTQKDRSEIIEEFKTFKIQAVVSVGMVTTGFDAPNIDMIVLLRPTKSAVLYVQMVGRGLRIFTGKNHTLVLDFAGNVARLGPINDVLIPQAKGKKKSKGEAPVKICGKCGCYNHTIVKFCVVCGNEFIFKQKIKTKFDTSEIVRKEVKKIDPKWMKVNKVQYYIHKKPGKPNSLKVIYQCGLNSFTEYVCLDHPGYAGRIAQNWLDFRWYNRPGRPRPLSVEELFNKRDQLKEPCQILVSKNSQYPVIEDVKF